CATQHSSAFAAAKHRSGGPGSMSQITSTTPDIFWFLPTSGDTRYLGKSDFGRAPTNEYLRSIAVTSENLGYDGLLIPTGASCLDPWVVAASLVPVTQRIKLLVALRTSLGAPVARSEERRGGEQRRSRGSR